MRISRTWGRVAGGAAVAAAAVMAFPSERAVAKAGRGGVLKMTDIDVGDFAGVAQDHIINMSFTQAIDPSTVSPATVQVRAQNIKATGYSIQVPGTFQVAGSVIRFYPRLPTHLRDPSDPAGGFYQPGTPRDDATANAGFQPSKNHQITVVGNPSIGAIRSAAGRALNRTYQARFTTSAETPKTDAFTIDTYSDAPPPGFEFSNPPDKVASAADQYARHGGTSDVPSAIGVTLFGNKVPVSPATVRQSGNIFLTLLSRKDDPSFRKPIAGTPYIEQNFDTVRLVYQPRFPLPDLSTYALKVTKNVRDLTETYDFKNNAERLRLRDIYEFMVSARQLSPTTAAADLADPPVALIFDWPADPAARGVLKTNVLSLGDTFIDEIDPRVMVLFSTQDEPVTHAQLKVNFLQSEGYFDAVKSTAEWDQSIPGVANGVFTFAGGSGVDGPFSPAVNTTISADSYPQNTVNWRKVNILPNVIVTVTGSRPALIKCLDFQLDGKIVADGKPGDDADTMSSSTYSRAFTSAPGKNGGLGGPGGGKGGAGGTSFLAAGQTGIVGNDINGSLASAQDGGRGGLGGAGNSASSAYMEGGGGGGGGARTAGGVGAAGTGPYPTWNGPAGNGGAAALGNDDLVPFVGGAGGGAGGTGGYNYPSYLWGEPGGGGGGGGGALAIQTSGTLTIGASGQLRSRGGSGGKGSGYYSGWTSGPGGGGGGGSLLLRSSKGFNIANPAAALDVSGGPGGTQTGTYTAPYGGPGGTGFVRLEDPNGGISVPGATAGSFAPVGAGVPSYVYSKFIDVGVDNPKFTNFSAGDFSLNASNDAILIEEQLAIEDPAKFGVPLTTAIDANENSTNLNQVSKWLPIRLIDKTPLGNSFSVPGNNSTDAIFPIDAATTGKQYKFVRLRITFQLDSTQTATSPLPVVDQIIIHFDFNF